MSVQQLQQLHDLGQAFGVAFNSSPLWMNVHVGLKNLPFFLPNAQVTVWDHVAVRIDFVEAAGFAFLSTIYQLFVTAIYGVITLVDLCTGCSPGAFHTMKTRLLIAACAAGAFGVAAAGVVLASLGMEGTGGIVNAIVNHQEDIAGFLGQPPAGQPGEAD